MQTTTLGSYPKPDYLDLPDWFKKGTATQHPTTGFVEAVERLGAHAEELFIRAARDVIRDQVEAGVDVVTDGEVRREDYIHYHCRHLDGIDFDRLTEKRYRGGTFTANLPTVVGPITSGAPFLPHDWKVAQSVTDRPVKMTLPGPFTLADTVADAHYGETERLCRAFAEALNGEISALAAAGCRHIQLDEPVFTRHIPEALDFGISCLEQAFHGCPPEVMRVVHICCSYPNHLDEENPEKAPNEAYFELADGIDRSSIQALSIEHAHRPNDLALLERFSNTTVILGVIDIAKSRIEGVDEVRQRLVIALDHIDSNRLMAAPDCGLGLMTRELARRKLRNMADAAHAVP